MNSSKGLIYCGLGIFLTMGSCPVFAEAVPQAHAEALTRAWLAAGRLRLATKMPSKVKTVETFAGFHVVHLDPEGFVVTADDDEVEPVIAFSAHGRFQADPESPLWLLLSKDLPQRSARMRELRLQRGTAARTGSKIESGPLAGLSREANRNRTRWQRLRAGVPSVSQGPASTPVPPDPLTAADATVGASLAPPVRIKEVKSLGGRVCLVHDGTASVSILGSYDAGKTWQVLDSGVIQPVWISKQPMLDSGCWFRVETDGLLDEMTVGFMRNPPPSAQVMPDLVSEQAELPPPSDPTSQTSLGSISDVRVGPLVRSQWNQSSVQGHACYNYYTPNNYVCGCVATALAQLLRYWQYPTAPIGQNTRTVYVNGSASSGTTRGGNGLGGAYDWNAMPLTPSSVTYDAAQWQMIGALCYDAGVSVNMMYSSGGSGAYMMYCAGALMNIFQYGDAHYINYPTNMLLPINSCLAAGCPVLLGISANGASGHAIVCDGFGYDSGTLYHHLNLGWGGYYDAWYTLPNIGAYYGFNSVDTVIFNAFPTGPGELITGRVMTSLGVPVQSALVTAASGGQSYSAISDAKGYYGVKVPAGSSYNVTASSVGMSSSTRSNLAVVSSTASRCGNVLDVDFALNPFVMTAVALTNTIWLRWTAPTNCGMSNNMVYIRRRADRFPTNSGDGIQVYRGSEQRFVDAGVDNSGTVTNYYAIWGNDGSPYVPLGGTCQASACAAPGALKLYWTSASLGKVALWMIQTNGGRRFSSYVGNFSAGWNLVASADVDGDGTADLIWHHPSLGKVAYWMMDADGVRRSSGYVGDITTGWNLVGTGDIDGDGSADLIWHHPTLGKAAYWLLNSDGSKRSSGYVGDITAGWQLVGMGDLDRDGTPDLIWHHSTLGKAAYWFLNSIGTKRGSGYIGNITAGWNLVGVGDLDRDGTADLIWHHPTLGKAAYWLLNANGTKRSSGYVGDITAGWSLAGTGDIDGDGTADLIWQSSSVGKVAYWFLNPDGTKRSSGYSGNISSGWNLSARAPF